MEFYTHNRFMALWTLSGTTRVSRYQKKHSPTHTYRDHESFLICIYYDPWHPPCSTYVPDSLFCTIPLSKFSLFYLLAWHHPLHTPYISSPHHCLLFAAHVHTIATCFAVVPKLCHLLMICHEITCKSAVLTRWNIHKQLDFVTEIIHTEQTYSATKHSRCYQLMAAGEMLVHWSAAVLPVADVTHWSMHSCYAQMLLVPLDFASDFSARFPATIPSKLHSFQNIQAAVLVHIPALTSKYNNMSTKRAPVAI